jgi:adenylyltransferase/sulfurtransferase
MTAFTIIGVGGLGCPLALDLALGGARLVLVDDDRVELSNLPRQILFRTADVGRLKVEAAADALVRRGVPAARIEAVAARWSGETVGVVCEGSDSLATKFAVNDRCVAQAVPLVIGGVLRHEGQVFPIAPGGACYRCLFEAPPDEAPSCADAGVLGPTCGLVATLMASAARALAAGARPEGLVLVPSLRRVTVRPRPGCCAPALETRA